MDLYEQIIFANRLGIYLRQFKQKKPRLWEFSHSCEKAGRGERYKSRAYIYQPKDNAPLNVFCHHCGLSVSLGNFLKEVNPSLYNEYRTSSYKEDPRPEVPLSPKPLAEEPSVSANLNGLIPVPSLPKSSSVLKFLANRRIPQNRYKLLYVAKHFYPWAAFYKKEFRRIPDTSPRLVLPYYTADNKVIGFTARTFSPSIEPRYIHLRIDQNEEFIYGRERLDLSKTIYVTEGHIDSLFLDNAIAVGGANYGKEFIQTNKEKIVIIPDSDWKRNPQVAQQLKKVIDDGFAVTFLPDTIKGKDLNDIVKNGMDQEDLKSLIDSNVSVGMKAQLDFSLLKKCNINNKKEKHA